MAEIRIPQPEFPFRHKLSVQLRFNDADIFGHVNNTVYFQFFDLAKLDYFRQIAGGKLDENEIAMVVANVNCDFLAPAFLDENLEVLTQYTRLGEKSLHLEQRLVNSRSGEIKSICRNVMVGFDARTNTAIAIADHWRQALTAYEQR